MSDDRKPLNRKAYGSIGHLPNSRMGPADHAVHHGQQAICTERVRDLHDLVIVQEKLDGSCTAVAKLNSEILALGRRGYLARTSPFRMHHLFADWVEKRNDQFHYILSDGEWIVGEWLAQAHGTIYCVNHYQAWMPFDLFREGQRVLYEEIITRLDIHFYRPHTLHVGTAISVEEAMRRHEAWHYPCDQTEGVVYRVERKGVVDFLAKWVRPEKVDGKYLESVTGGDPVWNIHPGLL